jgi:hypothetical protein
MSGQFEVKKVGEVTIIRLYKRKTYTPQRKPSVKRFFREIRALIPCQAEIIKAEDLENLILKTFGDNYQYHILISDEYFRVITKEQMEKLLKEDDTDTLPYINVYADCDDFSDVLLGQLTRKTWTQGYAIGQIWWLCSAFGHAQNLFTDGKQIFIVEPQNDEITTWDAIKSQYKDACAFMVKF